MPAVQYRRGLRRKTHLDDAENARTMAAHAKIFTKSSDNLNRGSVLHKSEMRVVRASPVLRLPGRDADFGPAAIHSRD